MKILPLLKCTKLAAHLTTYPKGSINHGRQGYAPNRHERKRQEVSNWKIPDKIRDKLRTTNAKGLLYDPKRGDTALANFPAVSPWSPSLKNLFGYYLLVYACAR